MIVVTAAGLHAIAISPCVSRMCASERLAFAPFPSLVLVLLFRYANGIALDRQMRGLGLLYGCVPSQPAPACLPTSLPAHRPFTPSVALWRSFVSLIFRVACCVLVVHHSSAVLPALAVDMRDGLALPFSSDGLNFDDQGNALDVASIRALCHDIVAHRVPDERFYERNPLASPPAAAYTGTEQVLEAMQQATTEADAAAGVEEDRPPAHSEL